MKKISLLLVLGSIALVTSSCGVKSLAQSKHEVFKSRSDYKKTSEVFRDEALISKASSANTKVVIDLSDQRAQMLVEDKVALDLPCCTGKAGKRTPTGSFKITSKIATKRSNIFGSLYKNGKKVYGGDRRKYSGSYDKYVGSALPYWMRLTDDGIGMHYSAYVHRYPGSNGCIRMPKSAVKTIFAKTKVGTPVQVIQ